MDDQDYIRKGAELADGFHFDKLTGYRWISSSDKAEATFYFPGQWNLIPEFHTQVFLDALAAQLERQYQDGYCRTLTAVLWVSYIAEMRRQNLGTDLTMWKIRYLVSRATKGDSDEG